MMRDPLTWRYPPLEARVTGMLRVSSLHEVYYEESGNPQGKPVLFVHGGPGGGTEAGHRQFFDPRRYRIVLFDQRGCGKSKPYASLEENTTWDLVEDMEKLRKHLGIERWQVFGGSWGSTLSLAYAATHPERVTELVLRGIFLGRNEELDWLYQGGANRIFPDGWTEYEAQIPTAERGDFVAAYHKRLTGTDSKARVAAAVAWSGWEGRVTKLIPDADHVAHFTEDEFALAFARIECHYFFNKCFFSEDGWLLKQVERLRKIPAIIVHGRYDVCCPIKSAFDLAKAWPEAELMVIPDAGHAASEPGIARALTAATDRFAMVP